MNNTQKFNYLIVSLKGKAASVVEGSQFTANHCEQDIMILKGISSSQEQSADIHTSCLLWLRETCLPKDTERLRKIVQKVKIHMLTLEPLQVAADCCTIMLMPVFRRVILSALVVDLK